MRLAICAAALAALATPSMATTVMVDFGDVEEIAVGDNTIAFTDEGFETVSSLIDPKLGIVWLGDNGILSTNFRLNRFGTFTPRSIDISFVSQVNRAGDEQPPADGDDATLMDWATAGVAAQAILRLTGWLDDGGSVSMDVAAGTEGTVTFGEGFAGITALDADILFPAPADGRMGAAPVALFDVRDVGPGQAWCMDFCVGATLDNLVADVPGLPAPVPLPASAVLLGGALALLGAARRRA